MFQYDNMECEIVITLLVSFIIILLLIWIVLCGLCCPDTTFHDVSYILRKWRRNQTKKKRSEEHKYEYVPSPPVPPVPPSTNTIPKQLMTDENTQVDMDNIKFEVEAEVYSEDWETGGSLPYSEDQINIASPPAFQFVYDNENDNDGMDSNFYNTLDQWIDDEPV